MSLLALAGGSHVLQGTFIEFVGSGHRETVVEYPVLDLCLLKKCLHKCASVFSGSLDPFSLTEFIEFMLKGAKHRDCMSSPLTWRRATESGDISMPNFYEKLLGNSGIVPSF